MSSQNIHEPSEVQLFIGIMFNDNSILDKVLCELETHYGTPIAQSDEYDFSSLTQYYREEMGDGIKKRLYAYGLVDPSSIVDVKILTNTIEQHHSENGLRQINLDPGYITENQVVLVSSKNRARRIYLNKGIYAELTLIFTDNSWNSMDWTYVDFRKPEVQVFLSDLRKKYLKRQKSMDSTS